MLPGLGRRAHAQLTLANRTVSLRAVGARHSVDPAGGAVALTFDDGPDPEFTPRVLDVLGELGVTATFFVVGEQVDAHPGLVRRLVAEGHTVGSHSASHPEARRLRLRPLAEDYGGGRRSLEGAAHVPVRLFRPPKGHVDATGAAAIRVNRLRTWLWTVDPRDWRPGARAEEVESQASALRAGDVILLHDGIRQPVAPEALDRSATVAALPRIVAVGRARGLRFVPLPS